MLNERRVKHMVKLASYESKKGADDMQTKSNLQEIFLTRARKQSVAVTVFLVNGFQLRGVITGFDSFVVVLVTDGKQQMIYKHAISTIIPQRCLRLLQEG